MGEAKTDGHSLYTCLKCASGPSQKPLSCYTTSLVKISRSTLCRFRSWQIPGWQFVRDYICQLLSTHQTVVCSTKYWVACKCRCGAFILTRGSSFHTSAY